MVKPASAELLGEVSEIYFYGTCMVDLTRPEAGLAAMRLLDAAGLKVRFPAGQTCCSQPAFNSGFRKEARRVAETQLDIFPKPLPIIVPSSSCAEMFREHFGKLFEGTPNEDKALSLTSRIHEWGVFFEKAVAPRLEDQGPPIKIYCHTSCHGRHHRQNAFDLLARLKSVEVLQIPHATECCGFGGAFSVKHTDLSGHMVHRKADEIIDSGAEALVSGECSCLLNIEGALRQKGCEIPCYHLADFILERIHAK